MEALPPSRSNSVPLPLLGLLFVEAEGPELLFVCCRVDIIRIIRPLKVGTMATPYDVY
jgi:hypothetical protein